MLRMPLFYMSMTVLLFAGVSCTLPQESSTPESELYVREIDGNVFDTTPVYGEKLPLRLRHSGFEYKCSECHSDFDSVRTANKPEGEHADVLARFNHGRNVYCLNCHHQNNREAFVDDVGNETSGDNSTQLCSKCHGPKHRDWTIGVHGRRNGFWDKTREGNVKLECVQCHDPHNPTFPLMVPDRTPLRTRFTEAKPEKH